MRRDIKLFSDVKITYRCKEELFLLNEKESHFTPSHEEIKQYCYIIERPCKNYIILSISKTYILLTNQLLKIIVASVGQLWWNFTEAPMLTIFFPRDRQIQSITRRMLIQTRQLIPTVPMTIPVRYRCSRRSSPKPLTWHL